MLAPPDCGWPEQPDYPRFAAVEERWFTSVAALRGHVRRRSAREGSSVWHYEVTEHMRKDERPNCDPGQCSPGVKQIFLLTRPTHRTHADFAAHWLETHHPLALRHHVGMWKYVQNLVVARFGSEGSDFDGIAELHYPSLESARNERYGSEEGKVVIAADRPQFVGASVPLFTREWTLAAGRPTSFR
jgi:uncharacterized protein (TIGR02118 family)